MDRISTHCIMSLATDSIFIAALSQSEDVMEVISGRLYGTAIPMPDEDADNVPAPYVIVSFNGLTNDSQTKDCPYEGDTDSVQIGIEVTADSLGQLHDLTQLIREVVLDYMENLDDNPVTDYQFSAQPIVYDPEKPCYWQVLNYQCEVYNSSKI
jgi:hypothetical protein